MRLSASWDQRYGIGLASFGNEWSTRLHLTKNGLVEVVRLGAGAPIILVPGLAGGWRLLLPLARRLARSHEVILYGLAGDRQERARPRTLTEHARDLADLIRELRLERPTVFGVSYGGAIALELATERPHVPGSLVLYGVEAQFRAGLGYTILRRVLERYALPTNNPFFNQFFNILHGGRPESAELAEFIVETCWETDQSVIVHRLRSLDGFDVTDRLWRVEAPSLVLAGARDVVVPPGRQRALAQAIPGAHFTTIEGAGHVGFLTHGAEVCRQVRRMLRTVHRSTL